MIEAEANLNEAAKSLGNAARMDMGGMSDTEYQLRSGTLAALIAIGELLGRINGNIGRQQ